MIRISLFIFLLFRACLLDVHACSCIGPDKFVQSTGSQMLRVEVIDEQYAELGKHRYSFARLFVKEVWKGDYTMDTLYILNDQGFECFQGLPDRAAGKEYIVTGEFQSIWAPFPIPIDSIHAQRMMVLDLCKEDYVQVHGDHVLGNITKNKHNQVKLSHKLLYRLLSEEAYYNWAYDKESTKRQRNYFQKMSVRRFKKMLVRRELI